jgi:hypothetical protein
MVLWVLPVGRDDATVDRRSRLGPFGGQDEDRLGVKTAQGVTEDPSRDRVDPLEVVEGDDEGSLGGQTTELSQDGAGPVVRSGVGPEDHVVDVDAVEQVGQGQHRGRELVLGGPSRQHAVARCPVAPEGDAPQRRLADAGLAPQDHHPGALTDPGHQVVQALQLGFPADERGVGEGPRAPCHE